MWQGLILSQFILRVLYPTLATRLVSNTLLIVLPLFCGYSFHISGHVVTESQLSVCKLFVYQLILFILWLHFASRIQWYSLDCLTISFSFLGFQSQTSTRKGGRLCFWTCFLNTSFQDIIFIFPSLPRYLNFLCRPIRTVASSKAAGASDFHRGEGGKDRSAIGAKGLGNGKGVSPSPTD